MLKKDKNTNIIDLPLLVGILCGAFYWILESMVHVFLFHKGTLMKQIFTPDSHEIWMRLIVISSIIIFGGYAQFIINRRRQMERELRKAKEEADTKYLALVNQAKDGIIIVQEGLCKFANQAMADITGLAIEEMVNRPVQNILVSDDKVLRDQRYKPCCLLADGKTYSGCETKLKRKDGIIRDIEVSTASIQYQGEKAIMGIIRDVSERHNMEKEVLKAQKLESLGILAGGIAHDFNNILVSIIGSFSLLKLSIKPKDKSFEALIRAEKAAFQARDLVRQLLTFSQGGAPIKQTVSTPKFLKETGKFSLRGSKVRCEYSLPKDLLQVEIDERQMTQAVGNLIINADQAMPEGGIIKVRAENVKIAPKDALPLKEGEYVKVSIQDQGPGIPAKYLQRIFDPYFTPKERERGLELATTYSIMKKHGGHITAESKLGVGTTFSFYLPASHKEIPAKRIAPKRLYAGKGKILVMDDEQMVREMLAEMLSCIGYEVELAPDGDEAIEAYRSAQKSGHIFDAVIMDLTIPGGMGGQEAIKKLRTIDPGIKAIVSSGYSHDPVMSEFKQYGFDAVLAKPYQIKELSETLYTVIDGSKELCLK